MKLDAHKPLPIFISDPLLNIKKDLNQVEISLFILSERAWIASILGWT